MLQGVGEFRKTRHPRNVEFNKVLEACFSGAWNSRFSEAWNLWSLEFANVQSSGILIRWRSGVTNMRKPGISNCRWPELRRTADSGICRRPSSAVSREDIHEPGEKQSQSCCPKKSGFRVWTSDRFVNMLDEKDNLVCVHTRNILWGQGCYRYVKVPSSPYKMGRKGTCKRIQTFWNSCYLQRGLQSLCALTLYLNVWRTLSRVRAVIRIFRVTPTQGKEGGRWYYIISMMHAPAGSWTSLFMWCPTNLNALSLQQAAWGWGHCIHSSACWPAATVGALHWHCTSAPTDLPARAPPHRPISRDPRVCMHARISCPIFSTSYTISMVIICSGCPVGPSLFTQDQQLSWG
jgi:hypothetical protein